MTEQQWECLLAVIRGEAVQPLPAGFIIDSPWLPNWAGVSLLDYFTNEQVWFDANMKALTQFPEMIALPGFWSEFGMCTEPSAFGAVCQWEENEFPFARPIIKTLDDVKRIEPPNPRKDGLLPFVIKRLQHFQPDIERIGHRIRFAVARGPLNIASFLMGTTEFLTAIKTDPDVMHQLLTIISDFLIAWIQYQRECFPTIDGLLMLDDIVGFVSKRDFEQFGRPYLKKIYAADVSVKFFHNDAPAKASAPYLSEIGINMFNFGIQHTLAEMKAWTENRVVLVGNIPPRDVLAKGTPEQVARAVTDMLAGLSDTTRLLFSCAGGMPPGVSTENIQSVLHAVSSYRQ